MTRPPVTRRRAIAGAAGTGLALPVLAACGDDSGSASDRPSSGSSPSATPSSGSAEPSSSAEPSGSGEPSESESESAETEQPASGVVATGDVPVGSGVILGAEEVVVTQPTEGDIHVFTTTCTHQGCAVTEISADGIVCPCHGSAFDISTGDVIGGPAPSPLPTVDFALDGDQVVLS